MKEIFIFGIVIVTILAAFYVNIYFQRRLQPRTSIQRLLIYMSISLVLVFILTFLMVFIIGRLFPGELMK